MAAMMQRISRQLALCAALAALSGGAAWAQDNGIYSYKRPSPTTITSFGSLYDLCTASADTQMSGSEHSLCVGYFNGIVDYYLTVTPASQQQFCLPSNPPLTRAEGREKLIAWSESNPAAAREPAAVGVYQFLVANFPCGAQGSGNRGG